MSKYLWLLDNGHGGIINGEYKTKGKRSPLWDDGTQLFEGEFNRSIVNRLIESLTAMKIDYVNVSSGLHDVPLETRVRWANFYGKIRDCVFVSIHANAGGGSGFEVYTTPGQTKSDEIADVFFKMLGIYFTGKQMRCDLDDGDFDKESKFYVLRKTSMPAILTENLFMDNRKDCKILLSREGRDRIAAAHCAAIRKIESLD